MQNNTQLAENRLAIYIALLLFGFVSCSNPSETSKVDSPYVIMVSFDGFRHDYVEKFDTPNFKAFIKSGVAADGLIPSFPSKTFPNHYSIVSGLYPGNHGLVDNSFYDRKLDLNYRISNRKVVEDPRFYGGTPLWQLTQENGMKSASFFWVGSEAPIKGRFPDYYHIYDGGVPNEKRIDAVIDWLNLPVPKRPQLITLYFSLVDDAGHRAGPNAEYTAEVVKEADRLLGLLMNHLAQVELDVNVILVSDHGMHEIKPERANYLSYDELQENLDRSAYTFVSNGAHAHFYVHDKDQVQQIYEALKENELSYSTFRRADFPSRWHYQNNKERIGDIVVTMDAGHYLSSAERIESNINAQAIRGEHGFDPYLIEDMQGIFYAKGPQIKEGVLIEPFENVNIYPFVARLLGISALPAIDGNIEVLEKLIK